MKKTAAAASALALGAFASPAHADDPAAAHDWSGFYLGASAGAAALDSHWDIDGGEGAFSDEDGPAGASRQTGAFAVEAGFNHQIGGLVIGGVVDYTVANFEENIHFDGGNGASLRTKIHGVGTIRGRVGYAMDRVLFFVTGGVALGGLENTYRSEGFAGPAPRKESTREGWVSGGGVEVAISENVSLIGEALFASFSTHGLAQGPSYNDKFDVETDITMGRLGVNFRF